jgi:hypothetical protein
MCRLPEPIRQRAFLIVVLDPCLAAISLVVCRARCCRRRLWTCAEVPRAQGDLLRLSLPYEMRSGLHFDCLLADSLGDQIHAVRAVDEAPAVARSNKAPDPGSGALLTSGHGNRTRALSFGITGVSSASILVRDASGPEVPTEAVPLGAVIYRPVLL